jgi:hypothetical protein
VRGFVAIALLVAAAVSSAHAADRHSLVVRGTVVDVAGDPMASARVFLEGPNPASSNVDANGRFTLRVPIADWSALERAPLALWVDAGRTGWTFNLPEGAPALRLEISAHKEAAGARRCVIRSNDAVVTSKLARGIERRGALRDTIELRFVGAAGPDAGFRDLPMFSMEEVAVAAPVVAKSPSPAPPKPVVTPPKPAAVDSSRPPVVAVESTQVAPKSATSFDSLAAIVVVRPGDTVAVKTPSSTSGGDCACRIEGTVEVYSREPLSGRTPVVFWLEGNRAVRDSVELFMGSPRPFVLNAKGCGNHRVRYEVRGRQRFNLASPDPVIDCTGQRTRQVRIVLAPPGR